MDQDLVMAGVGRNDGTDMDPERRRKRRDGNCAGYTEVVLKSMGLVRFYIELERW